MAATTSSTPIEMIVMVRETLGRNFSAEDLANGGGFGTDLYEAAAEWLGTDEAKNHDLSFVRDVASRYARGGGLTDRQAAGILNCMVVAQRSKQTIREARQGSLERPVVAKAVLDTDDLAYDAWLLHQASSVSKGFYTVVADSGRKTFRVSDWKDDSRRPGEQVRWIGLLTGSDNTSSYTTCARQDATGALHLTRAFQGNAEVATLLASLMGEDVEGRKAAREAYALESGCCARCGKLLTVPASIHRGLGPDCAGKVGD